VRIAADGRRPHRAKMCARPKPTPATPHGAHSRLRGGWARFTKTYSTPARPATKSVGARRNRGKPAPRVAHFESPARQDLCSGSTAATSRWSWSGEERNAGPLQSKVEWEPSPETIMDPIPRGRHRRGRQPRMYQLIRQKGPTEDVNLKLIP